MRHATLQGVPARDEREAHRVLSGLARRHSASYQQIKRQEGIDIAKKAVSTDAWSTKELAQSSLGVKRHIRTGNLLAKLSEAGYVTRVSHSRLVDRLKRFAWGRERRYTKETQTTVRWRITKKGLKALRPMAE